MTHREALDYLLGLQSLGVKLGLQNIRALLRALGSPDRSYPSILVTGSNGKGSVVAMLGAILRESGRTVGVYTSPHLVRIEERISVDGQWITPRRFTGLVEIVRRTICNAQGAEALQPIAGVVFLKRSLELDLQGRLVVGARRVAVELGALQQVLTRPREFDVIATMNLNGDYLSDALAAQVGGIGIAPGGNINYVTGHAIFEATHGTAPKYADQDKVNPGSLTLSGEMMLRYLGWNEAADLVVKGVDGAIGDKIVTYDFARQMKDAREVKCSEFADAIIEHM